jgi:hypothetical protein
MPIYVPGKVVLQKEFTQQSYMWEFPAQYGLWSPANITTALWLDAADASTVTTVSGAVSQWNDKSGNARHATQGTAGSRPAYSATSLNSLPGFTFDGSDDFLALPNSTMPSAQSSVFAVFKTGSALVTGRLIGRSYNAEGWTLNTLNTGAVRLRVNTTNAIATTIATSSSYIAAGIYDQVNTSASIYDNTPVTAAETGAITYGASDTTAIGAATVSGSFPIASFNGVMSEIIVIHSAASTDTRQRIYGYLAHKWGLTANLPNDHPYKTVGPTP